MAGKSSPIVGIAIAGVMAIAFALYVSGLLLHLPPLDWTFEKFIGIAVAVTFISGMASAHLYPAPVAAFLGALFAYLLAIQPEWHGQFPSVAAYIGAALAAALISCAGFAFRSYRLMQDKRIRGGGGGTVIAFSMIALFGCYAVAFGYFLVLAVIRQAAGV